MRVAARRFVSANCRLDPVRCLSSVCAEFSQRPLPMRPRQQPSQFADPLAVVRAGHARFTVLTPELIRMEWG